MARSQCIHASLLAPGITGLDADLFTVLSNIILLFFRHGEQFISNGSSCLAPDASRAVKCSSRTATRLFIRATLLIYNARATLVYPMLAALLRPTQPSLQNQT